MLDLTSAWSNINKPIWRQTSFTLNQNNKTGKMRWVSTLFSTVSTWQARAGVKGQPNKSERHSPKIRFSYHVCRLCVYCKINLLYIPERSSANTTQRHQLVFDSISICLVLSVCLSFYLSVCLCLPLSVSLLRPLTLVIVYCSSWVQYTQRRNVKAAWPYTYIYPDYIWYTKVDA